MHVKTIKLVHDFSMVYHMIQMTVGSFSTVLSINEPSLTFSIYKKNSVPFTLFEHTHCSKLLPFFRFLYNFDLYDFIFAVISPHHPLSSILLGRLDHVHIVPENCKAWSGNIFIRTGRIA